MVKKGVRPVAAKVVQLKILSAEVKTPSISLGKEKIPKMAQFQMIKNSTQKTVAAENA